MPYIIVFRNNEKIMKYRVHENKQLRIGRSPENDINVVDSAVSAVHAEIDYDGGFFYITDFQSRNGTFVNRELVISRRLAQDDVISIGNHNLKFIYKEDEKQPSDQHVVEQGATMHIDTPYHRSRIARSVADFAEREKQKNVMGVLNMLKADCQPLFLDKPVVTIGKDPDSDIVLKGWFAAGNAAEVKKKQDGYYLNPVSGKPPLVNSQPIRTEVLLREFDMIQIGSTTMQFQYHRSRNTEATTIL